MNGADRRDILKTAIGVAIAPFLLPGNVWAAAGGTVDIAPPSGPMIYRRWIERGLGDGAMLTVTREFSVEFVPFDGGFSLRGQQVAARASAPSSLSRLAALEEERVETGIFPLTLDRAGLIVDGDDVEMSSQLEQAVASVRARLSQQGDVENATTQLVAALQATNTHLTAQLPRDLFAPGEGVRSESRPITLPWGDSGLVSARFEAQRDPQSRLMKEAQREVVTHLGSETRSTLEGWQLFPA